LTNAEIHCSLFASYWEFYSINCNGLLSTELCVLSDCVILSLVCAGVQPVALNLSQSARGRVPVLPYVIPSAITAQSSASTVPAKQGIAHHLNSFSNLSVITAIDSSPASVAYYCRRRLISSSYCSPLTQWHTTRRLLVTSITTNL